MSAAKHERSESSEAVARRVAEIAGDKGATDVVALDVRSLVGYTDFLVICTARNERQAKAIHDDVRERMAVDGRRGPTRSGRARGRVGAARLLGLRAPRLHA